MMKKEKKNQKAKRNYITKKKTVMQDKSPILQ